MCRVDRVVFVLGFCVELFVYVIVLIVEILCVDFGEICFLCFGEWFRVSM